MGKYGLGIVIAIIASVAWLYSSYEVVAVVTLMATALALWIIVMSAQDLILKTSQAGSMRRLGLSYWAMLLGHIGLALVIMSVALTSAYSTERDVRVEPGEQVALGGYDFRFDGVKLIRGPNYTGHAGVVTVFKEGELETVLHAEKRRYDIGMQFMTEAAVDDGLTRDLYLALGEQLSGGAWSLRIYHKPYVRVMWLGGILISLAGFIVLFDRRYRRRSKKEVQA